MIVTNIWLIVIAIALILGLVGFCFLLMFEKKKIELEKERLEFEKHTDSRYR